MADNAKMKAAEAKREAQKLMTSDQITKCNVAIHTASAAAAAGGFLPIPVMDSVPISAAQVTMMIALGKIFDQKVTESAAKALVAAAASTLVGRTIFKFVPFVGWAASASIAAGVTEAIGWGAAVDFAKAARNDRIANQLAAEEKAKKELEGPKVSEIPKKPETPKAPQVSKPTVENEKIEGLKRQANEFISGKKPYPGNEAEYVKLWRQIKDIADQRSYDDPIRKIFNDLDSLSMK